jgi:flagellar biosynthesis protein FliQ
MENILLKILGTGIIVSFLGACCWISSIPSEKKTLKMIGKILTTIGVTAMFLPALIGIWIS